MKKGKRKFVFLGRQTINGKLRLLIQQTCPSMILLMFFCNNHSMDNSALSMTRAAMNITERNQKQNYKSQDLKFEDCDNVTLLQRANSPRNRYSVIHIETYFISALFYSQVRKLYFYCCKRVKFVWKKSR